jgi:hypothetical protein
MMRAKSLNIAVESEQVPEITHVDYDLWMLRVTLQFENQREPYYAHFAHTRGFRVLDESDLLEFWNKDTRPKGWLWEIEEGGWIDLEKTREGFLLGTQPHTQREFLIVGLNECVSVIGSNAPTIQAYDP